MHKCYHESRAATAVVATMLAGHRAVGTWLKAVDVYIALTEFGRRKLVEGGVPEDKIAVKPIFAYPDPGPGAGTGGFGVFIGRLSAEKGIKTFLTAWQYLGSRLPLKIIGDGPKCPWILRRAEHCPLSCRSEGLLPGLFIGWRRGGARQLSVGRGRSAWTGTDHSRGNAPVGRVEK